MAFIGFLKKLFGIKSKKGTSSSPKESPLKEPNSQPHHADGTISKQSHEAAISRAPQVNETPPTPPVEKVPSPRVIHRYKDDYKDDPSLPDNEEKTATTLDSTEPPTIKAFSAKRDTSHERDPQKSDGIKPEIESKIEAEADTNSETAEDEKLIEAEINQALLHEAPESTYKNAIDEIKRKQKLAKNLPQLEQEVDALYEDHDSFFSSSRNQADSNLKKPEEEIPEQDDLSASSDIDHLFDTASPFNHALSESSTLDDALNERENTLKLRSIAHKKASSIATEMIDSYELEADFYAPLVRIFEGNYVLGEPISKPPNVSPLQIKTLARFIIEEAIEPHELTLMYRLRRLWAGRPYLWSSHNEKQDRTAGSPFKPNYQSMSWQNAFNFIRAFPHLDSFEEIKIFILNLYNRWYENPSIHRQYYAFLYYLNYFIEQNLNQENNDHYYHFYHDHYEYDDRHELAITPERKRYLNDLLDERFE